jgi:hypothetical protein
MVWASKWNQTLEFKADSESLGLYLWGKNGIKYKKMGRVYV